MILTTKNISDDDVMIMGIKWRFRYDGGDDSKVHHSQGEADLNKKFIEAAFLLTESLRQSTLPE